MNTITEITRRAVADWFTVTNTPWWGRLDESSFVGRIFDLSRLPSNDYRCSDMGGDISMHRDHWTDWENDWVFFDSRLNLLHGPDERFVAFLCEVVHPVVRPDAAEAETIVKAINDHLRPDGWQIVVGSHISGRPVYVPQQASRPLIFDEPTGWEKVDRQMAKVKTALAAARTEEEFQGVGLLCREVLISAAQEAWDSAKHPILDGTVVSNSDAKRMLEAFIAVELPGEANEEVRALAKSAMKAALALQHKRGADFKTAALCAEGAVSVVGMVAILTGKRNKAPRELAPETAPGIPAPASHDVSLGDDIPF